jgi:hypothetical protein
MASLIRMLLDARSAYDLMRTARASSRVHVVGEETEISSWPGGRDGDIKSASLGKWPVWACSVFCTEYLHENQHADALCLVSIGRNPVAR